MKRVGCALKRVRCAVNCDGCSVKRVGCALKRDEYESSVTARRRDGRPTDARHALCASSACTTHGT